MVIESDNQVISSDYESNLSYNELNEAFETLYDEYNKLGPKHSLLKRTMCGYLLRKIF